MRYSLRALRWASIVLWICFFLIIVTVVYSAFNIKVEVGDFQILAENENIVWAQPFVIDNAGFYDVSDLNITTILKDTNGTILVKGSSHIDEIPKKECSTVWHNVSINLEEIPNYQIYLTNDAIFTIEQIIYLNFAKILPFSVKVNSTMAWGAPLYNLSISRPSVQHINSTHSNVSLNVSFENHSPISLEGTVKIEILNEYGEKIGVEEKSISVLNNSPYEETMEILVDASKITSYITVKVSFETSLFSYETEVQYGGY